ncbi:charged multivesicular body protein 1b [Anaeramoeba flamelloides]|uniref:Charged multivesicular body protein 1b n=2 Tax=Anaeramoeba flamelloides TaxID=1746091 RepID=A0ABQ8Z271_9EUKA|nr:charged multivesicular body protein 1b [Anaeramoeba flamelloides]
MSIFTFFAHIWGFITKIFHYVFVFFSDSNLLESSSNDSVMVSSDEYSTNEEEEEGNSNLLKETEYQKKKLLIQQKQWAVYFNKTIDFDEESEQKKLRNTVSQNKPFKQDKENVIQIQNKPTKETKNIENNDLELVEQKHEEQQQQFNKTNKKKNWLRDHQLFQLKFTSKSLSRQSRKCEKEQKKQIRLMKKAIQKGNQEGARIYAENSIRQKNQAMSLLKLSSRIDGVASKIQTALTMKKLTRSMKGVVGNMSKAMEQMNLVEMTSVMDKFEEQFDDLGIMSETMGESMDQSISTPNEEVDLLIQQVSEEHGLSIQGQMKSVPTTGKNMEEEKIENNEDSILERLNKLKN